MALSGIGTSNFISPQSYAYPRSEPEGNGVGGMSRDNGNTSQQGEGVGQAPGVDSAEQRRIQQEVTKLKANEEKVKAHEAAHKAAGGQYASSASYSYRPGPDGRSYIVAGEVQIDMSPGRTPEETIAKMQVVQRAALAPADPSGQDRAVAAQAAALAAQAQQEKTQQSDEGEQSSASAADSSSSSKVKGRAVSSVGGGSPTGPTGEQPEVGTREAEQSVGSVSITAIGNGSGQGDSRQVGAYRANTNPGDIFIAPKMSTYA